MKRRTISRWMLALLLANPLMIMAMDPGSANPGLPARQATPGEMADVRDQGQPADQQEQPEADAQEYCALCEDDVPVAEMRQLGCNHRACVQCLLDYKLNPGLDTDWRRARTILRCNRRGIQPGDQPCTHVIDERDIRAITGDEARVERYSWVMLQLDVDAPGSPYHSCPGPLYEPGLECDEVYFFEEGQVPRTIGCVGCRRRYCAACKQPHRRGVACPPVGQLALNNDNNAATEAQEQRAAQIAQNDELLRQTGAACPTCGRIIQKTEGCNHMHCPNEECARLGRDDFCFICQVPWVQAVHGGHQFEELFCYLCRQPWGPRHDHHPEGQRYTIADWNHFTEPFCKYHARPYNQTIDPRWDNGLHGNGHPCQRREPIMRPMVGDVHAPVIQAPAQEPAVEPARPEQDLEPWDNFVQRLQNRHQAARAQRQLDLERLQPEDDTSSDDEPADNGFRDELQRVHDEALEQRARRVRVERQDDRERARLEVRQIFGEQLQQEEALVQRLLELRQGTIFRDENHAREYQERMQRERRGAQERVNEVRRIFGPAQEAARVQRQLEQEEQVAAQPEVQRQVQPVDAQPAVQEVAAVEHCTVCLDDEVAVADMRQLGCGHRFCAGCLGDRVDLGLREWQEIDRHIRCPRRECPYVMNDVDIRAITQDDAQVNRFNDILTDRFINANPNFRRCPTAGCEIIYEFERPARTIRCARGCREVYCSDCREQHPQGAPCGQANVPIQNNNNEDEQRQLEWIRANTRPCPNCRANIQKNGGCNHMTCRNCRFEFCWFHLRAWNEECRRGHHFNAHPELEEEAAQAAAALRVVPEPAPAQRPAIQPVQVPVQQPARPEPYAYLIQHANNQIRQEEAARAQRQLELEREERAARDARDAQRMVREQADREAEQARVAEQARYEAARAQRQAARVRRQLELEQAEQAVRRAVPEPLQVPVQQPAVQAARPVPDYVLFNRQHAEERAQQRARNEARIQEMRAENLARLEEIRVQNAQAEARIQPAPVAQRVWPAQNRGDYVPDHMSDEEIARLFAQGNQNNHEQIRPNPHGPNDPNPNDPDNGPHGGGPNDPNPNQGRGPRFQEVPEPSNAPLIIGAGLVVAAIGATTYGCYKLYNYLIQPKPDSKMDLKTALAELHKEATKSEILATSHVYTKGAIKAFFQKQVKAGSFAALKNDKMELLIARIDAFEHACSNQGAIEAEYAAFMRCVSDLVAAAPEVPVKAGVKQAVAKKQVAKRVVRAKRGTRKVTK